MLINQTNKERFYQLCNDNKSIPLFIQPWWMDAVCNYKDWDVLIYEKNSKVLGVLVYYYIKKFGFRIIIQPQLTQFNGIWINNVINLSKNETTTFEKEVMTNLVNQLDELKFSYYDQNFHHSVTNWLPFHWKQFEQTTRYTYQISDISDPDSCFQQFRSSKKSHIKRAEKSIKIGFEVSGKEFYSHLKQNLKASGQRVYYSEELFLRIFEASKLRNQGCVIAATDEQQNLHAALFIVWDENCAYNLISTINPQFRSSGASSLVFWEAIKYMSTKSKLFDFEGSMNKNIEESFREFGSVQLPYFRIRKFNSVCFKILFHTRKWYLRNK